MTTFLLIGIGIILTLYLLITQYLFKTRLRIERNRKGLFHQDRNRYFVWFEGALLVLFVAAILQLNVEMVGESYSIIIRMSPLFVLFFLMGISSGTEEWLSNPDKKSYYYDWTDSSFILALFLFLTFQTHLSL